MKQEKYQYSKEEFDSFLAELKELFFIVRVIEENQMKDNETFVNIKDEKFLDYRLLENTFTKKEDSCHIEFIKDELYLFFIRYLEVEKKPIILEIITRVNVEKDLESQIAFENKRIFRDEATGIYNKRFYDEVETFNRRLAGIALIELNASDQNEKIKDRAMHGVVKVLMNNLRGNDRVIRYSDQQFLIVLEGINEANFELKLEQIRKQINLTVIPGYGYVQLSSYVCALVSNHRSRKNCLLKLERLMDSIKIQKKFVSYEWKRDSNLPVSTKQIQKKPLVLIVDDNEINSMILEAFLEKDYQICLAKNGEEALHLIERYHKELSLVLLDIKMPEMDGMEVLKAMDQYHWLEEVPVIMISAEGNEQIIERCFDLGASDYIQKPFSNGIVLKRVNNIMVLYQKQKMLQEEVRKKIEEKNRNSYILTSILSHIVEYRNGESGPHVMHVEHITEILLNHLSDITDLYPLSEEAIKQISSASALHDIGKMGIDEAILNKPGKLTDEEFEIMKKHTVFGSDMVKGLDAFQDEPLARYLHDICRWHHEKWDGRGYPDGLKGDEIPICAQVVSVADVYDALVSDRVYKKAYSHQKAIEMILNGECGQFNPILMTCLKDCHKYIIQAYAGGEQKESRW